VCDTCGKAHERADDLFRGLQTGDDSFEVAIRIHRAEVNFCEESIQVIAVVRVSVQERPRQSV
jgi:hypothetical protein